MKKNDELWKTVRYLTDPKDYRKRISSLWKLLERDVDGLDEFVLVELENKNNFSPWTDHLIRVAERLDFHDHSLRARLYPVLFEEAKKRNQKGQIEEPLFSAMRRYASIAPCSDVKEFAMQFLAENCQLQVKQLALQCIQNMFYFSDGLSIKGNEDLFKRIRVVAKIYLLRELSSDSRSISIGINAVLTLAALNDPKLLQLVDEVNRNQDRAVVQTIEKWLEEKVLDSKKQTKKSALILAAISKLRFYYI